MFGGEPRAASGYTWAQPRGKVKSKATTPGAKGSGGQTVETGGGSVVRGFVSGIVWGGVVSVLGLGVASQLAAPPRAVLSERAANLPTNPGVKEVEGAAPRLDPAPMDTPAPEPVAEEAPAVTPDVTAAATEAAPMETAPAPAPEAEEVTATAPDDAPEQEAPTPLVAAEQTPPAQPVPGAEMTDPAPSGAAMTEAPAPDQAPLPDLPATTAEADLPPLPGEMPAHSPLAPETEEPAAEAPSEPVAPAEPLLDKPGMAATPADAPGDGAAIAPPAESASEAPDAPTPPQPGLTGEVAGVTTGRLPSIGSDAPPPPAEDALPSVDAGLPLARYAAPFENPANKPLYAVLLIDDGKAAIDRAALAALSVPVTLVLDPTAADADKLAALYRGADKEVAMLATAIPAGAKPSDLEVTFETHAKALPEAVAVVDLPQDGFQNNRALASALVPVVKAQGRGLVTFDKGLNAGDQVARREAVPAARIFRELDGEGEAAPLIRRYLDRAAFKAAQDGQVVVLGHATPEMIAALTEWALEGRAGSVALAPLSAVLARAE